MATAGAKQPIIIKKKKGGGHGHHGGAWKIAYADMVTAMMAFFLVMWICGMDIKTRLGIADYFNNPSASNGPNKPASWFIISSGGVPRLTQGNLEESKDKGGEPQTDGILRIDPLPNNNFDPKVAEIYGHWLITMLNRDPQLAGLKDAVLVEVGQDALRVALMEGDQPRFFQPATATWTYAGRKLALAMAAGLGRSTQHIAFEGHTTPAPPVQGEDTRWELGAKRALALRAVFDEAGLSLDKVRGIKSMGDIEPLFTDRRDDPRNLRVMVVIPYSKAKIQVKAMPQ